MLAAFSPDGRLLATSCWDGEIRLWNAADGRSAGRVEGCRVGLGGVAFASKPPSVVAAWCKRLAELAEGHAARRLTPSGGFVFGVQRSEIASGNALWTRGTTACPWAVDVDKEGGRIAAGFEDGQVLVWPEKQEEGVAFTVPKGGEVSRQPGIVSLAFLPGGRVFAMAMWGEGGVWDARSGKRLARLSRPTDGMVSASVSPKTETAAVATWGKQVELFDLRAR
jgi:WD40 repeat protein